MLQRYFQALSIQASRRVSRQNNCQIRYGAPGLQSQAYWHFELLLPGKGGDQKQVSLAVEEDFCACRTVIVFDELINYRVPPLLPHQQESYTLLPERENFPTRSYLPSF